MHCFGRSRVRGVHPQNRGKGSFHPEKEEMRERLGRFFISEEGTTSIEYAIIAGLIFLAIVAVVSTVGSSVRGLYESVAAQMP